jgi:hypothetical protein
VLLDEVCAKAGVAASIKAKAAVIVVLDTISSLELIEGFLLDRTDTNWPGFRIILMGSTRSFTGLGSVSLWRMFSVERFM